MFYAWLHFLESLNSDLGLTLHMHMGVPDATQKNCLLVAMVRLTTFQNNENVSL